MVKLTPEQQGEFVQAQPEVFEAREGRMGRGGATSVRLKSGRPRRFWGPAMAAAWCHAAPRKVGAGV